MFRISLFSLSLLLLTNISFSQVKETANERYTLFSQCLSPEKVFVRTDKSQYLPGEIIKLDAFLEDKSYNSEFPTSNFIYVELLSPETTQRIKLKRQENAFSGYLSAPEKEDTYIIRAYTYWNLNTSSDYYFTKKIKVVTPEADTSVKEVLRARVVPESGHFLLGQNSNFTLRAKYSNGAPAQVSATIINTATGEQIATFQSDSNGLSAFHHQQETPDQEFAMMVKDAKGDSLIVPLPQAISSGAVANLKIKNSLVLAQCTFTPDLADDSLFVVFHNGSQIYYSEFLKNNGTVIKMKEDNLPPGIHCVAIFDKEYHLLANRCFFVKPTSEDAKLYSGEDELEYMMIGSEFKGGESISPLATNEEIDLFMAAQKWQYYNMEALFSGSLPEIRYGREYVQTVSGKVKGLPKKNVKTKVTFMAPAISYAQVAELDSSGRFVLSNIDFPEETTFSVRPVSKNLKLTIEFDPEVFAPRYPFPSTPAPVDTLSPLSANDSIAENTPEASLDPHRRIVPKYPPSSFENQDYEAMNLRQEEDMVIYRNWELPKYIVNTFNGLKIDYDEYGSATILSKVPVLGGGWQVSSGWMAANIFINRRRSNMEELNQLYVGDVLTIAYLTGNDATIYAQMDLLGRVQSVAILVYTKQFSKDYVRNSINNDMPLGWQK